MRRRSRVASTIALCAAMALTTMSCTTTPERASIVKVSTVTCPPEIAVQTVLTLTCSFVTVPEDRSRPQGAEVRLFVMRLEPDAPASGVPVVYVGGAIGTSFDYRNLVDVANTLSGHELIAIELRGTGHSSPNLSCPEVDALAATARAEPIDDARLRGDLVNAVTACRARIVAGGVDPADFDVAAMAADVLDVVAALHLSAWEFLSKGSTSRVVFEAMRSTPEGLRAVVLDNPEFPDTDPFVEPFVATRAAAASLAEACRADPMCRSRFPHVAGDLEAAIDRLQFDPVIVRVGGQAVLMDGAAFLRTVRAALVSITMEGGIIGRLPATIDELAGDQPDAALLARVAALDDSPQTYCTGFLPVCSAAVTVNQGAYYSVLCRDELPFADLEAMTVLARDDEAWVADYVDSPYLDVCRAWDVAPAAAAVSGPVSSDVPVLIDTGAFSSYLTPRAVRAGVNGLSDVSVRVWPIVRAGRVRLTAARCLFDLRESFLDDPHTPPVFGCRTSGLRFSTSTI
jgi:pimeloyl-ACP methyl ester carboxylesterase